MSVIIHGQTKRKRVHKLIRNNRVYTSNMNSIIIIDL